MLTINIQEFNVQPTETTAQRASLDNSWLWEMTTARGAETTMHPHSTTTGFTKGMFQLSRALQHIHKSQGSPKACSSWHVFFNTFTHHRVHERHVPAGVSFSAHSHITGFTKGVFQLACIFQHIHTSQGSPKACSSWRVLFNTFTHHSVHQKCSSWSVLFNISTHHRVHQRHVPAGVSFSAHSHITGFTKGVFQLVCPFQHIHTSQGSPKACSSWRVLFNTFTHHRVHQRHVPAGVSFSTHSHITGFTKGVFQLACPFQHIHTSQGSTKECSSWRVLFNTFTHHRVHQRRVPVGVSFSTHSHITVFTKSVPVGLSFSTHSHITVFTKSVPVGLSFSTHSHITVFTKGVLQLACPFQHIHTSQGSPKVCSFLRVHASLGFCHLGFPFAVMKLFSCYYYRRHNSWKVLFECTV